LLGVFGVAASGALAAYARLRRRARPADAATPEAGVRKPPDAALALLRGVGLVLAGAGALAFGGPGQAVALWTWSVATLGSFALVVLLLEAPRAEPPARGVRLERGLFALAFFAALFALVAHRPDIDDSFYVNLAVAAADAPADPLLAGDTLHGIPDLPLNLPIYRLHSYELWNGAVSYLTGLPAIAVFHLAAAAAIAFLVPLVHARLFRLLTPKHWLAAVATLVIVLAAAGETHRWYGNLAFVRIWQGKALQLFVFVPLIYVYALRFALRPSWPRWGLLALAQIAALGSSSTALWAAPAASAIALCSGAAPSRRGARVLAAGLLASAYVLGAAFVARGWMQEEWQPQLAEHAEPDGAPGAAAPPDRPGHHLEQALDEVLGEGRLRRVALACVLGAWAASGGALARRFALVAPLATWLVLLEPHASAWIIENVTGESTFWRGLWVMPVPILMTLCGVAPLAIGRTPRLRGGGIGLWALALLAFVLLVPSIPGPGRANNVRLGWPSYKVMPGAHRWAEALAASAPPGSNVVAPRDVSVWLPTFHHGPHPLSVRNFYLARYRAQLGAGEIVLRVWMTAFAEGRIESPDAPRRFGEGLDHFSVKAVCLRITSRTDAVREVLRESGFRRTVQGVGHEIWVRA
jgi:hypothetical protein